LEYTKRKHHFDLLYYDKDFNEEIYIDLLNKEEEIYSYNFDEVKNKILEKKI